MKNQLLLGAIAASVLMVGGGVLAPQADALTLTANLSEFTGDNSTGTITLTDLVTGGVRLNATNIGSPSGGDIAGIWFGLKEPALGGLGTEDLSNLVVNAPVSMAIADLSIYKDTTIPYDCPTAPANNLNGGGSPCGDVDNPINVLLQLDKPGSSAGLVQNFSVDIAALTVGDFYNRFGMRYQTTTGNEGSSKLGGTADIPTPAVVLPILSGLFGVASRRKSKVA